MRRAALAACSALALAMAGCSGGSSGGSPAAPAAAAAPVPAAPAPPIPSVLPKDPEPAPALAAIDYDAKGRRDPFAPVTVAPQKVGGLSVGGLKLTGVIGGSRTLLALVEAPDGLGYILKPGDMLGDGRVTDVTGRSVTFSVAGRPGQPATAVTLTLAD
jgi:Tfp pilus assembly protein PilP